MSNNYITHEVLQSLFDFQINGENSDEIKRYPAISKAKELELLDMDGNLKSQYQDLSTAITKAVNSGMDPKTAIDCALVAFKNA